MILQLNPALPIYVQPHERCPGGKGYAHLVIDYGGEHHIKWVVFLDATKEVWAVENPRVRAQNNITLGRFNTEENISGVCHHEGND